VLRRSGWLDRKLSFAEIGKLQGLQLVESPFDRRHGMASLVIDTAGASPLGHRLELDFLPAEVARACYERLAPQIGASALRW
jgi:putative membrane protein